MQNSLNYYYDLEKEKKDKIQFLRYEDIARDPLSLGEKIHNFLQLEFTDEIRQLIKSAVAVTDSKSDNQYTTRRKMGSNQILNSWRLDRLIGVSGL